MIERSNHDLPEPLPGVEQRAALYRIAYEQGLRSLSDQVDELNGMRTRAVAYMAFIGTATAFLVTATVNTAISGKAFFAVALCATLSVGWAVVQMARVIRPGVEFTLRLDPRDIIARWIDFEVPVPNEAQLLRSLAGWLAVYIEDNERSLEIVRRRYTQVIVCGGLGLLLWSVAIWVFGRVGLGG